MTHCSNIRIRIVFQCNVHVFDQERVHVSILWVRYVWNEKFVQRSKALIDPEICPPRWTYKIAEPLMLEM